MSLGNGWNCLQWNPKQKVVKNITSRYERSCALLFTTTHYTLCCLSTLAMNTADLFCSCPEWDWSRHHLNSI